MPVDEKVLTSALIGKPQLIIVGVRNELIVRRDVHRSQRFHNRESQELTPRSRIPKSNGIIIEARTLPFERRRQFLRALAPNQKYSSQVTTSQNRILSSFEAVANVAPSGKKNTTSTDFLCP